MFLGGLPSYTKTISAGGSSVIQYGNTYGRVLVLLLRDGGDAVAEIIASGGAVRVVSNLYKDTFSMSDDSDKIYVSNSDINSVTIKNNTSQSISLTGYTLMGYITSY